MDDLRVRLKTLASWPIPSLADALHDAMAEDEIAAMAALVGVEIDGWAST